MKRLAIICLGILLVAGFAVLFQKNHHGKRVFETFLPSKVDTSPVSTVTTVVYHDDRGALTVYFSDRPRADFEDFPPEVYHALKQAEDQSAYYFEHIEGQYKPY
jgi:membrane peptidoglycan carboxypeptidase